MYMIYRCCVRPGLRRRRERKEKKERVRKESEERREREEREKEIRRLREEKEVLGRERERWISARGGRGEGSWEEVGLGERV
ncbi:predicted protein [Sclerotinia sclerotiorum 1980 UF-70]|nr:predicted protein [Sclerotinia sclerotiorum 1980 UF-70]EDN95292.1 predicted protein [Sclerotinia sclerotiorum 1980 UF-70]